MTSKEKIERFWRWFVGHKGDFTRLTEFKTELYPLIIEQVKLVHPGLVVDFELAGATQVQTLVVSAEGNVSLFPLVMRMVAAAPLPKMPQWHVVAFRQPRSDQFELQFPDYRITTSDTMVKYKVEKTGKIALDLKIQNWDEELPGAWEGVKVMLDNVVGEYAAGMKIGTVSAKQWELGEELKGRWVPIIRLSRIIHELVGVN